MGLVLYQVNDEVKDNPKMNELYRNFRSFTSPFVQLTPFEFVARRFGLILVILTLKSVPLVQYFAFVGVNVAGLIWQGIVRPYEIKITQRLIILNECVLIVILGFIFPL